MGDSCWNPQLICDILGLETCYPCSPGPDVNDTAAFRAPFLSPAKTGMSKEPTGEHVGRFSGSVEDTAKDEFLWRTEEQNDRTKAGRLVTIGPLNREKVLSFEDQDEELLPGLPNEVVIDQIVPKLPWRAFHILSSVSRCWQQAIRSHQVYNARVCSHSTETLLVLNNTLPEENSHLGIHALCLYSVTEDTWRQLSQFPHSDRGIPHNCKCVVLDGKIYVLGGETSRANYGSREVYVLDLAGQRESEQCASMLETREDFVCGVMNGTIFVVGFTSLVKLQCTSEVYDPKDNTWSAVTPIKLMGFDHDVVRAGQELFLLGGQLAYHAGKDEWRMVSLREGLFTAQGKLHMMTKVGIFVHGSETDESLWIDRCSFSFSGIQPTQYDHYNPAAIPCVINDELLAVVDREFDYKDKYELCRFQSQGFSSQDKTIVLEKLECSLEELGPPYGPAFLLPIEL